ncbi:MAG: OsmC family protein [Bacteroidales bacterium]|nr:OsmC family protein [Bacteroidales bacterium]MCF8398053.1 OsmC family protein [Bacteroidales bacterium]
MNEKVDISWKDKMAFEAIVNDHKITIDARAEVGGEDKGPRPKPLLLASLGGCTGMDVISILKKMRVEPEQFNVSVEGHNTDEHPKHYDKLHIKYFFKGKDLPMKKLEKAVNLSQERYCGVSYLLGKGAEITHEIIVED